MKLALLFLLPLAVNASTLEARRADEWIRIYDTPCTSQVANFVPAEILYRFTRAEAMIGGKHFEACALKRPDTNDFFMIYEDADQGVVPMRVLKEIGA